MAKLESIEIVTDWDDQPDVSYLDTDAMEYYGKIRNGRPYPSAWLYVPREEKRAAIKEHGSLWNASQHYAEQDKRRLERFNEGDWSMIGIYARAAVVSDSGILQFIRSGGLWRIESDSDRDYLLSIAAEEVSSLRQEIRSMGLGRDVVREFGRIVREGEVRGV